MILGLAQDTANLEALIHNESMMGALSRVLKVAELDRTVVLY
jgi:hypothetical protein